MGLWTRQTHLSHRWSLSEQNKACSTGVSCEVHVLGEGCTNRHPPVVMASKKEWQ